MEIERRKKKVMHFILAIKPDGRVTLTVPYYATKEAEIAFLASKQEWLNKNYAKAVDKTLMYEASEGSSIYILGNPYVIRVISGEREDASQNGAFLDLTVKTNNVSRIKRVLEDYLSSLRNEIYTSTISKYLKMTNNTLQSLRIRKMYRANGLCYYQKKEIVLSTTLIHHPMDYIEAICLHEVTHLKYHGHQEDFYHSILSIMPDYYKRIKHLTNDSN